MHSAGWKGDIKEWYLPSETEKFQVLPRTLSAHEEPQWNRDCLVWLAAPWSEHQLLSCSLVFISPPCSSPECHRFYTGMCCTRLKSIIISSRVASVLRSWCGSEWNLVYCWNRTSGKGWRINQKIASVWWTRKKSLWKEFPFTNCKLYL